MSLFENRDYRDAEKKGLDAFTVMARAIREHFHDEEDKITPGLARVMAKIIDDGFLNSVIEEQANLIAHSKRIKEKYEHDAKEAQRRLWAAQYETDRTRNEKLKLEQFITALKELEEQETDTFLLGAKKAYFFMLNQTGDKDKASKAFNSYLQGIGKLKQYEEKQKNE